MNATETIDTIHNLIETCRDGQEGFRIAADDTANAELKALFSEFSRQRERFSEELKELSSRLGDSEPYESSSVAGALHRGWINLKAALTSKDEHSILAECERGEDSAKEAYRKALNEDLPLEVNSVVARQFEQIKLAHDKIRDLRDARAKAK